MAILVKLHVCSCSVDNTIKFEREAYTAKESVGDFTEVRLVADQPFAEDTSVSISFEDISANSQCSRLHASATISVMDTI